MSTERFPSSHSDPETIVDQDTIDEINTIVPTDNRELSSTASRVRSAAERVSTLLENRAQNKAQSEALAENQIHMKEAQDATFASYEDNVAFSEGHETALKMDQRYERNEAIKQRISEIGQRGLSHLKTAGEITLGVGIIGAEAAARTIRNTAEAVGNKASSYASEKVEAGKQTYEQTKESVVTFLREKRTAAQERKEARVTRRQERRDARDSAKLEAAAAKEQARAEREAEARAERETRIAERAEQAKVARERAEAKAREATERKQARRESRQQKINASREKIASGRDKTTELWQRVQTKRRSIGARVVALKNRARASGQAAIDTWKQDTDADYYGRHAAQ